MLLSYYFKEDMLHKYLNRSICICVQFCELYDLIEYLTYSTYMLCVLQVFTTRLILW